MASVIFMDLQDSPHFHKQAAELESSIESLQKTSKKLVTGGQRYASKLEDFFQETMLFADCLESCSKDESLRIANPSTDRFLMTLRELSSRMDMLRAQLQLVLCERLGEHSTKLTQDLRNARKIVKETSAIYSSVRDKLLGHGRLPPWSSSKSADPERAQESMILARNAADEARFDLARRLVDAHRTYRREVIESITTIMQAHVDYYDYGSATLHSLAPCIDESVSLTEALKEEAHLQQVWIDELMQAQRSEAISHEAEMTRSGNSIGGGGGGGKTDEDQPPGHGKDDTASEVPARHSTMVYVVQNGPFQMSSGTAALAAELESYIRVTAESRGQQVTVLKQGYLLKQSSKFKGKWQRRFFVLDSTGTLYYYSSKNRASFGNSSDITTTRKADGSDQHLHNTVNLITATVKPGVNLESGQQDIPYAFRVISPGREYALQAEDDVTSKEWMETLQCVISCLLSGAINIEEMHAALQARNSSGPLGASLSSSKTPLAYTTTTSTTPSAQNPSSIQGSNSSGPLQGGVQLPTPLLPTHIRTPSLELGALSLTRPTITTTAHNGSSLDDVIHTSQHYSPSAFSMGSSSFSEGLSESPMVASGSGSTPMRGGVGGVVGGRAAARTLPSPSHRASASQLCSPMQSIGPMSSVPGNSVCADCGVLSPEWGSLNLGIVVCIECSGFHRKLGVHVSKIRSLTLDVRAWEGPVIAFFQRLGNAAANEIWEGRLPKPIDEDSRNFDRFSQNIRKNDLQKPTQNSSAAEKEQFIVAKYQQREFALPLPLPSTPKEVILWNAITSHDVHAAYHALVAGADVAKAITTVDSAVLVSECHTLAGGNKAQKIDASSVGHITVLHAACREGDVGMMELLLQWGSPLEAQDVFGRSPLMYAALHDKVDAIKQLLRRHANAQCVDVNGRGVKSMLGVLSSADGDVMKLL